VSKVFAQVFPAPAVYTSAMGVATGIIGAAAIIAFVSGSAA
jgi:hypothetical protein